MELGEEAKITILGSAVSAGSTRQTDCRLRSPLYRKELVCLEDYMRRPTVYEASYNLDEINQCRRINRLPPIKPKKITCMKCGEEFESWFPTKVRHCEACNWKRYDSNCGSMGMR